MIPLETQESWEGNEREQWRVNSCMIYLIHCKNICKFYSVPAPGTTINEMKNK
jgi:hypothetical protein